MKKIERDQLAKRVAQFYENGAQKDSKIVIKHFKNEGFCPETIRIILKRYKEEGKTTTSSPPGRKNSQKLKNIEKKVFKILENNPETSSRNGATKLGISKTYFNKIKVHKLKIKGFKKQIIPESTKEQQERAKKNCRKLYKKLSNENFVLLMDDETYVYQDPKLVNCGPEYYHAKKREDVSIEKRTKKKKKFAPRFLIWQAIDQNGNVSEPFVTKDTMKGTNYLNCLRVSNPIY